MRCKSIKGGFSFCGVDIGNLGLTYVPENENTYVYRPSDVNVYSETFEGHNGEYFYGVSKQPKEFLLRCYFEDEAIDRGVMERIYNLFRYGKSGKLIFDRKPWCYYYATVTSLSHPELSNYMNGLVTITMQAYYPFARGDDMYYSNDDEPQGELTQYVKHDLVMESTALVETEDMVPPMTFSNLTSTTNLILHNPGTEYAPLSVMISGDAGEGVIIENKTTKEQCAIIAMDKAHTDNVSKYLYIDGINGSVSLIDDYSNVPSFGYHDYGFIRLKPAYPATRNIFVESSSNDVITLTNTLYDNVEGQYIYINNTWYKILQQIDSQTLKLSDSVEITDVVCTMITRMNEIEIRPVNTMDLTHLSFSYKPTYS